MISHRQIMINLANILAANNSVRDYAVSKFGRGAEIIVGAYGVDQPGVKESPFIWLVPQPVENEEVGEDMTFSIALVVGGLVTGPNGEKIITKKEIARTATANGLTVNGGDKIVEDFRDLIANVIRDARPGAILSRIRRQEDDLSHFPLEWAEIYIDYIESASL